MKVPWRTKIATLAAGASIALVAPQAAAAPADAAAAHTGAAAASVSATQSSATGTSAATPQALPCGFGFWQQSYRNCTGGNIFVVAPAHESATGEWFEFNYCLEPGESRQPLANWGMWVWLATHTDTGSC